MATLPGQRAQFTWALNQYNLAEDPEKRAHFAKRMAKYIAAAPSNGFTVGQVTQGQLYPGDEVAKYISDPGEGENDGPTEKDAIEEIAKTVDASRALRLGEGPKTVYAYGYLCAPDRLKIGLTEGDAVERIAAQIGTGTPDKPFLLLEIRTRDCNSLERAIHATLDYRGSRIMGGGKEWFKTTVDEIVSIYESISKSG